MLAARPQKIETGASRSAWTPFPLSVRLLSRPSFACSRRILADEAAALRIVWRRQSPVGRLRKKKRRASSNDGSGATGLGKPFCSAMMSSSRMSARERLASA